MKKVNKQIKIIFMCLIMYIVDFLAIPAIMYAVDLSLPPFVSASHYPASNEIGFLLDMSIFCITMIGMFKISGCIIYWLIGDILYCFMIFIYHPAGAYGIGERGMFADAVYTRETNIFEIICMFVLVAVVQSIVAIIVAIVKFVRKMMMKDSDSTMQR